MGDIKWTRGYRKENKFVLEKGVKLAQVYFEMREQQSNRIIQQMKGGRMTKLVAANVYLRTTLLSIVSGPGNTVKNKYTA